MIKILKNYNVLSDGSVFRNLAVVPESVIMTGEGRFRLHNWKGLLKINILFKKKYLEKNICYVVVHNTYTGYFHWLLESLPKIIIAKKNIQKFTILLPIKFTDKFYNETLKLIGVEDVKYISDKVVYKVPIIGLPYLKEPMGSFSSVTVKNLRKNILASSFLKTNGDNISAFERIYISRKKATRRKIINELELENLLTPFGFTTVCFEDYTIYEQIILCSNASSIISIHGAGLSNILFMPEGSNVIELRKFDNNLNHTYERLANALGHTYSLVYCPAENETESVQDANVIVNLTELATLLDKQAV